MRIMIGSESFHPSISGVAVATRTLAAFLAGLGHQVLVLAPSLDVRNYEETYPDSFEVSRLRSIPNPFRKGFRVTVFPRHQVSAIVARWRPQVIHLEDPASICSSLLKAGKAGDIPIVISHHFTLDYVVSYLRYFKFLHRPVRRYLTRRTVLVYNECRQVICPTETVSKWLHSVGVTAPIAVVSNGVDLNRFFSYSNPVEIRSRFSLPDLPAVLYVGRVDQDKQLETLLAAVPLALERVQAHFVICGGGNLLKRLQQQSTEMGIDQHISFLGQLDHDSPELPGLYQIAACFVIPSAFETQSIVTLEAMASGLPVVAAASGALPELVADGENGYLFQPGNAADLAEKITIILNKPELAMEMGHQSLKKVHVHELNPNLRKIERIYNEVLEI